MEIILIFLLLTLYFAIIAMCVVSYVLSSRALFILAKRRGIKAPGLAWVPVASDWIVGSLADEYESKSGPVKHIGKVLLTLSIISVAASMFVYALIMFMTSAMPYAMYITEVFVVFMVLLYVVIILMSLVSVAYSVIYGICLYRIYESTVPEKTIKYLLLSMMVPMAGAICLNKCKNAGYPEPVFYNAENNIVNTYIPVEPPVEQPIEQSAEQPTEQPIEHPTENQDQ